MGTDTIDIPYYQEVDYHDPTHRYFCGKDTYTSSTQLISEFYEHFDKEERSQYMEERYGRDADYWKGKWHLENKRSLVRGNEIHNAREEYLYGRGVDTIDGRHLPVQNRNLLRMHIPYITFPDGVYPELKLWHHGYRIAGRSDKIIFRTVEESPEAMQWLREGFRPRQSGKWRVMDVEDYKTNKAIRKESFYRRDPVTKEKIYKMMKPPISHLMDCEFTHYSLQLSLYQYMGEYHGFVPGNRRIIHYQHEIEGLGTPDPVVYELPYLRDEVIAMLEHRRAS